MTENEAKNILENVWDFAMAEDEENADTLEKAIDIAIKSLKKQEKITKLLKCHDDFNVSTTQVNYELVIAIRVILEIDEKNN